MTKYLKNRFLTTLCFARNDRITWFWVEGGGETTAFFHPQLRESVIPNKTEWNEESLQLLLLVLIRVIHR